MKMMNFYKDVAKRFTALALAAGILGVPEGYEALHKGSHDRITTYYSFDTYASNGDEEKASFTEATGAAVEDDELTQQTTQTTPVISADVGFGEIVTTSVTTVPSGPLAYVGDKMMRMENASPWDEPEIMEQLKDKDRQKINVRVPEKSNYSSVLGQIGNNSNMDGKYYTLTVSTGISPGTNVEYFAVRYLNDKGNPQTKYIFPKTHSLKATHDFIKSISSNAVSRLQVDELDKKHSCLVDMGYTEVTEPATKALSAWTVDDFMFEASDGISKITSVEAFLSEGSWTVQGIAVSRVNSQAYYGEYGFYSGKYFLAIDKTRICELQKKKQGTLTLSAKSDTLVNIGGSESIYFELNSNFDDPHIDNPLDDLYSIRIDIADELKAGIETYLKNDPADYTPAANINLEHVAVEIEYQDKNGWTRNVTMPLLLSVLGQYEFYNVKNLSKNGLAEGNVRSVGLCQRGDTVAFTACLPEFKSLISTKVYVGSKARDRLKETGGIQLSPQKKVDELNAQLEEARKEEDEDKAKKIQEQIENENNTLKTYSDLTYQLDNDDIAISSISIYEGLCVMGNTSDIQNDAGTWYSYTSGFAFENDNPVYYSTTTKDTGFILNAGTSDSFSMKAYDPKNPLIGYKMTGNFMVRIKTDKVVNSGTAGDVTVKLSYQDATGQIINSRLYNVRDEVMNYLGYWPSDKSPTSDYAYLHGVAENNIIEFPVTLEDVVAITGIELSVDSYSNDEWQVDSVAVAVIDDIGNRFTYVQAGNVDMTANEISDGDTLYMKCKYGGKYLSVNGSAKNGANVIVSSKDDWSEFTAVSAGNGWFYLVSQLGDGSYVLDVNGGSADDQANIQLNKKKSGDSAVNQLFKFQKNKDGTYTILTKVTNGASCVDFSKSTNNNVHQYTYSGLDNQKWYIEFTHGSSYVPSYDVAEEETAAPQTYDSVNDGDVISFRNKKSGLYIGVDTNHNLIQTSSDNRTKFVVKKSGDFTAFYIEGAGTNTSRNFINGGGDSTLNIKQSRVKNIANTELYRMYDIQDGTFTFETGSGGFLIDVSGGSTDSGAAIKTTSSSRNYESQYWYVEINGVDVVTPKSAEKFAEEERKAREAEEAAAAADAARQNEPVIKQMDYIGNDIPFMLKNVRTGMYLAVEGDAADGARLIQQSERNDQCAFVRKGNQILSHLGDGNSYAIEVIRDDDHNVVDLLLKSVDTENADQRFAVANQKANGSSLDSFFFFMDDGMIGIDNDVEGGAVSIIPTSDQGMEEAGWIAEEAELSVPEPDVHVDAVSYATNLNPRTSDGDNSAYYVIRVVEMTVIPPFPLKYSDEAEKTLIIAGQPVAFSTGAGKVIRSEDLDFDEVRYSMPYEYTSRDYGYTRSTKTYDLIVKVADDPNSSNINGDSGSKNYFYFQLQFKYGGSALVLANQQLSSDGFRAGLGETFSISINRDYGELTAVRIIPEDVQEDSDIFDKLNIEQITVTERVYGDTATQYVVDNVGWIGIDYHDSAEDSSIQGRSGRSIGEIAKTFSISYKQVVVNFLVEVNTLPWDTDYLQVEGSIACDLDYIDINGQPQTASFDVVKRMAEYMNKAPRSFEGASDGSNAALYTNMGCVSDPQWMLRPNHTDRFMLPSLPNVKSLSSITFYATSRNNKPGKWVIGSVSVSRIIKDGGIVTLNSNGEYYRTMETRGYCENRKERKKEQLFLPAGTTQSLKLNFNENVIDWIEYKTELSSVSRLPDSVNDELNIYIYPADPTRTIITNTTVKAAVQYTIPYSQVMQAKQSTLSVANSGTADAVFYTKGLSVSSMNNLVKMGIQCRDQYVLFDHAIVEQVREGVVVNTYHFTFHNESGLLGITQAPDDYTTVYKPMKQTLSLSLAPETTESSLFATTETNAKTNNIAVALRYTSTLDPGNTEYYTPYVYLTDVGINKISPGMMLDIPFDTPYVKDIKGFKIASFGSVDATVKGYTADNYTYSKANDPTSAMLSGVYSSNGIIKVENKLIEYDINKGMTGENTAVPLTISFKTAKAMQGVESGTNGPVQAKIYFTDHTGVAIEYTINDLRQYIQETDRDYDEDSGRTVKRFAREFETDSWKTVKLLLPQCDQIKSIWLCPYGSNGVDATWYLEQFNGVLGIQKGIQPYATFDRYIDEELKQSTAGIELALYDISLSTNLFANNTFIPTDHHVASTTLEGGDSARIDVVVRGNVKVGSGQLRYDANAKEVVNGVEIDAPTTCLSDMRDNQFFFTAPENNTKNDKMYRIYVYASDNKYVKDIINIIVPPKKETTTTTEATTTTSTTTTTTTTAVTTTEETTTTEVPPETTAPPETTTEAVPPTTEPETAEPTTEAETEEEEQPE